ncbi:MAG TPA: outer membrane beta-barrel protein [Nitrospiraceae bacterium]|nr:outer membrane beta-barrel protein [Nitrospiraceae bacterium]
MMSRRTGRSAAGLLALMLCGNLGLWSTASAADWVHDGQVKEGRFQIGVRAGLSLLSQEFLAGTDGGLSHALNVQAMYGLNKWFSAGLMVDWERRGIDNETPSLDLGTLNTVSILPTLEFHPGRFGNAMPYLSTGIGVNVNSFSETAGTPRTDVSNTFAFRLAGGVDFPLTSNMALNTEVAWKRNRGGIEVGGAEGNFDATTMSLLVGLRYTF